MIKVVSLTSDIVGEGKWFLKWRIIKRCNKEPSTLDQTTLNNGILFAPRDATKFSKRFHKVTDFNLPV